MPKPVIRICRYNNCPVDGKKIIIGTDEHVTEGKMFYHCSCYAEIQREKQEAEKEKQKQEERKKKDRERRRQFNNDFNLICNLWQTRISNTVNFPQLRKIFNEYIDRGVSSDYLVFVVQYCIDNKLGLHYPAGLRYMVEKDYIKKAYNVAKMKEMKRKINYQPPVPEFEDDPSLKPYKVREKRGFEAILNKMG